jgi:hypothetical protein
MIGSLLRRLRARRDPVGYVRSLGVTVGSGCRIFGDAYAGFGSEPYLVTLGDRVTITDGVRFVTHDGGTAVVTRTCPGWCWSGCRPRTRNLQAYREGVLAKAVYLTSTDPDERRAAVLDHVRRRGASPGPGRARG